jgi:hypothetical protein
MIDFFSDYPAIAIIVVVIVAIIAYSAWDILHGSDK